MIRIISRVSDHVRQMGGDVEGPSRNAVINLGGAGFKLLNVKFSFQVREPGFWGMFEKQPNLDGNGVDFVIYYASAMMLLQEDLTLIAKKNKVKPQSLSTLTSLQGRIQLFKKGASNL